MHDHLDRLRAIGPVAWDDDLQAWVATDYEVVVEWMRDSQRFTVDDPRFSTGQVLGPSMLSLDGEEHRRHRAPFAGGFGASNLRGQLGQQVRQLAYERVERLAASTTNHVDVRSEIAGPFAADVMRVALGLQDVTSDELLGWYHDIVGEVTAISSGEQATGRHVDAVTALAHAVERSLGNPDSLLVGPSNALSLAEVVSNTAVCMFGGIETAEGMIVNLFAHVLHTPSPHDLLDDVARLGPAIDESLRLEPSVTRLDRFATEDVVVSGRNGYVAEINKGDMVVLSIAGANRDPTVFAHPHRYVPDRENARDHVTFAQGPHACIAMHLSRFEAISIAEMAGRLLPNLRLAERSRGTEPTGTVFRKWNELFVEWDQRSDKR